MARHIMHIPDLAEREGQFTLEGDEARHALRVKRVTVGDSLLALDGAGSEAVLRVLETGRTLEVEIVKRRSVARPSPRVDVWSATPKGPRIGDLVDALSQAGASAWRPMRTERANVDPSSKRRSRLGRVAIESMKQCRRAWAIELEAPSDLAAALEAPADMRLVIADGSGAPYRPTGAERIRLLIGPEGGWTDGELERARRSGADVSSFGPHVMRIELAAAVATAIVVDQERRRGAGETEASATGRVR